MFNDGQLERIAAFYAADCVLHNPAMPEDIEGPDAWREVMDELRTGFPDFMVTIDDLIAEGDKVVQRSHQRGTFEGELQGLVGTGRSFETDGIVIYQIRDGKIVEEWVQDDMQGMMKQLGLSFAQILWQLPLMLLAKLRSLLF